MQAGSVFFSCGSELVPLLGGLRSRTTRGRPLCPRVAGLSHSNGKRLGLPAYDVAVVWIGSYAVTHMDVSQEAQLVLYLASGC